MNFEMEKVMNQEEEMHEPLGSELLMLQETADLP